MVIGHEPSYPAGPPFQQWAMRPVCTLILGMVAAFVGLAAGCASPARPREARAGEPGGTSVAALNGEYDVEFHSTWFGPIRSRMTAQALPPADGIASFKANTRPGVAWTLVGGVASALGPVLTPYLFPQGMLLTWQSTMPSPDGKPGEGWIGISRIGPFGARTRMKLAEGPVEVLFTDGRMIAMMTLAKRDGTSAAPMADYPALTDSIRRATVSSLFDPAIASSDDLKAYFDDVAEAASVVQDDLEYTFAGGLAWRKRTKLPLPLAYRPVTEESRRLVRTSASVVEPMRLTVDPLTGIATIEALAFVDVAMIDEVFAKAMAAKPQGIVLDLRSCTGFDLTALRAACWLMEGRHDAGRFVAATHRKTDASHDARMDVDSASSVEAAHALVKRSRAAAFSVVGEAGAYDGPLAVLTLERTRSSAEILAWLLRSRPDTRFFGSATAGRPRIDFVQPLEQGFVIRIPEFDWQSPGGELGVCKVVPDVRCAAKKAPAVAAEWLRSRTVASAP